MFSGEGHITASLQERGWQDYQFKARVKLIRGGIHLNYRDRNCLRYFIGFTQTELYLNRTFPCGTHTVLSRRSISHDVGRWYTITVNGIGGALKVYVDGTLRIEYSDDTSVLFGTVGLETLPDSHVHVDDVELNRANGLQNLYIGSLFMHPKDPKALLAGAGNNAWRDGSGGYLSTDGGETWSQTLSSGLHAITSVEFSESNPNVAYAGSETAIYRSQDGGRNWREFTRPVDHAWGPAGMRAGFPIDFQVDPREPVRLFANDYGGGNFVSADGGQTWQEASRGYTGAQMNALAVDPTAQAVVYAGGRSAFFKSTDCGASWGAINYPPAVPHEGAAVAISPLDHQLVLISDQMTGRLWRSNDGGNSWHTVADYSERLSNLRVSDANDRMQGFTTIAFAPSDPRIVYAGFAVRSCVAANNPRYCQVPTLVGVHYSSDGGSVWRAPPGEALGNRSVLSLAVHPDNPDIVYAATAGAGVLKSVDGGRTWASRNGGVPTLNARSLAIDPKAPDTIYLGTEDAAVFKSTDAGAGWRSASAGLDPGAAMRAIVIDPANSSVLWAGDLRSGVYRSADGARSWVRVNEGLRTRAVRALAISSDGGTLYAGTEGEGVFRLDIRPLTGRN